MALVFYPAIRRSTNPNSIPMSSPLKRKAPNDEPNSTPHATPHLSIRNSVPCGDPRCDIPTCLKGPFTTLYLYPPFSEAEIIAEVIVNFHGVIFF
jgi:hypothetical protein